MPTADDIRVGRRPTTIPPPGDQRQKSLQHASSLKVDTDILEELVGRVTAEKIAKFEERVRLRSEIDAKLEQSAELSTATQVNKDLSIRMKRYRAAAITSGGAFGLVLLFISGAITVWRDVKNDVVFTAHEAKAEAEVAKQVNVEAREAADTAVVTTTSQITAIRLEQAAAKQEQAELRESVREIRTDIATLVKAVKAQKKAK